MIFLETPIFTKAVRLVLSDEEYRMVQTALMLRPEQGAVIPGTGGLRKIRWAGKGHGNAADIVSFTTGRKVLSHSTCYTSIQKMSKKILPPNKLYCWGSLFERISDER
jgi:hypothetical protein